MSLAAGTRLGPYEVIAKLGEGGMGEVYRARDTTLHRDIALKVLPAALALDADRLARFTREAQLLAALNHPNIASIYGIEGHALVMELVEGEDMSALIARGPMPVPEAVAIARQIADGLDAAHEQGIIHRDLKPANVKVRPDGSVKLLDFGLAKAVAPDPATMSTDNSPTFTAPASELGMIVGTAAYMSPEQARGRAVDRRADTWAFGAVLYEMLTGRRAFDPAAARTGGLTPAGDERSVVDILAAVINTEPDWTALPPHLPPALRRLLRRCLEKDPRKRLRSIADARLELDDAGEEGGRALPGSPGRSGLGWAASAFGVAVAAIGAATAAWCFKPMPRPAPLRLELPASIADSQGLALSPDGTRIAYVADGHLRVRSLDELEAQDLAAGLGTIDALVWSPDSASIAFAADGAMRRIPAQGGPAFVICQIPASGRVLGAAWMTTDTLAFSVWRDSVYSVPAAGGTPTVLRPIDTATEIDVHDVRRLPGGQLMLSVHERTSDHNVLERFDPAHPSARTAILAGSDVPSATYVAPNQLLFLRAGVNPGLWLAPLLNGRADVDKARLIQANADWLDASDDGTLLVGLPSRFKSEFVWIDRAGVATVAPGGPAMLVGKDFSLSPDGRRVAFVSAAGGGENVVVRDLITGVETDLTLDSDAKAPRDDAAVSRPVWLPSGDRLIHTIGAVEAERLVVRRADAAGAATDLVKASTGLVTDDGQRLVVLIDDRGIGRVRYAPFRDGQIAGPFQALFGGAGPDIWEFTVSPDGRWIAYSAKGANGTTALILSDFPAVTTQWKVADAAERPRFSHDGRELLFLVDGVDAQGEPSVALNSVSLTLAPAVHLGAPTRLFQVAGHQLALFDSVDGYAVAPDDKHVLMSRPIVTAGDAARIVLVRNGLAVEKK